ncbi:major facilitator superfamily transporter [Stachybotrys elegans]|uniref:Major facilitator superfamily transporter n=1 Tax=Stachybotrys elegans TaxID=80388 RepID=A0A8K0WTE3_9HYPO|nr:major facilitator superfamily transporter [Stachybotrys elegans]
MKTSPVVTRGDLEDIQQPPEPPFTTFTTWQKRWILFLAAFTGMFSPLSSFIFYPAITSIANGLNVSVDLVNLAVTTYMAISGLVPAILGNAADRIGRRPIYILALSLYLAANLGLSVQNSYAGLLILRMLQSAGSSGTISLGYGVISDICTREERGSYVGILLLGPNVAPPVGPILGGILAARLGWHWIFRFLCILGGSCLLLLLLALPETSRVIVGNGSLQARGIHRTWLPTIEKTHLDANGREDTAPCKATYSSKLPNPLACLRLLAIKDTLVVLLCNGIFYTIYCCIQASLSTLFIHEYGYGDMEAGFIYVPFGVACLISTVSWGKLLDWDYARIASRAGISLDQARSQMSERFPIRTARLRSGLYLAVVNTVATAAYGWTIQRHLHVSVPLVLQTFVGFSTTGLFVALGTLLTDLNTDRSSTAAASANLIRCALSAGALAGLQPLMDHVGIGWCFTLFGMLGGLCAPAILWLMSVDTRISDLVPQ